MTERKACKHLVWGEDHPLNPYPDHEPDAEGDYCSLECERCDKLEGMVTIDDMCMDCYVGSK